MNIEDFEGMFGSDENEDEIDKNLRLKKIKELAESEFRKDILKHARNYYMQIEMFSEVFIDNNQITKDEKVLLLQNLAKIFYDLTEYEKLAVLRDILLKIDSSIILLDI